MGIRGGVGSGGHVLDLDLLEKEQAQLESAISPVSTPSRCAGSAMDGSAAEDTGEVRIWLAISVVISSWLTAVAMLWAGSYPSGSLVVGLLAAGLAVLTAVLGLIHIIAGLVARRVQLVAITTGIAVALIGGAAFAARIELPLLARFALVRPAFERVVAERLAADEGVEPCPSWIGTYRISNCRTIGSATYFTERDGGFLNGVGFAYLPDGLPAAPPTAGGSITYGQLRGPWYWYNEAW